jgi:very-short-patch-repair endonuclease
MFTPANRELAKALRRNPTSNEDRLWRLLRGRKLDGLKFRRQAPIGRYVVDFYCPERFLIVEADGPVHDGKASDEVRDAWLRAERFRVVRFRNEDIATRPEWVLDEIQRAVGNRAPRTDFEQQLKSDLG